MVKEHTEDPATPETEHEPTDQQSTTPDAADGSTETESSEQPTVQEESAPVAPVRPPTTMLLFQAPDLPPIVHRDDEPLEAELSSSRRRTRRRAGEDGPDQAERGDSRSESRNVVKVRTPREPELITEPQKVRGSTRLEAKKQRRRDGRDAGRRRPVVTEAEFLARRESVDRVMVVRSKNGKTQIGVLEDGVLVEHYVARSQEASLIGNVYLGRVQNVLPSMEAAFVDIGRGRNAVLYSGEVDWDSVETGNQPRRIELALKGGDTVLVQVTKDPVGHKGARLTSQVSLPGRYLVYVPNGSMNGISRKLPDTERARLKKILKEVLPENVGVIVRTAAEGATEEQLTLDVTRLKSQWAEISRQIETVQSPALLHSEPDLLIKIIRDVFNEDFQKLVIQGSDALQDIQSYLRGVAPDLLERVEAYDGTGDAFVDYRIAEQIEKALDRKVWLPSGGSLVIDRTEAMTVVDVNTGKFVGSGGNLEETVTKNNLEAAEEVVRQLRLRDIGGIIVVDFIDMVLETNRDLVLRRLVECLSRDRTKHQVAEVTSLGLVQMTRKKLGLGLLETFSEPCEVCAGRGVVVHHDPVVRHRQTPQPEQQQRRRGKGGAQGGQPSGGQNAQQKPAGQTHGITDDAKNALALIAARTLHHEELAAAEAVADAVVAEAASAEDRTTEESTPQQDDRSASSAGQQHEGRRSRREKREPRRRGGDDARRGATEDRSADTTTDSAAPTLALLDLPIAPVVDKPRRAAVADPEHLLESVLDALPEPKQPGQGRGRSRRVSTASLAGGQAVGSDASQRQAE
ncbi:Rne/Rng family ribonuclease [Plantibacter sp. VKM Ac-2880]|uniref:Rne/Rng family ribonuclease n=1 Tax=Plantibacter sp. VKM Ac-2880 TaxID=2783827 RepID=UPI00351C6DC2